MIYASSGKVDPTTVFIMCRIRPASHHDLRELTQDRPHYGVLNVPNPNTSLSLTKLQTCICQPLSYLGKSRGGMHALDLQPIYRMGWNIARLT